MGHTVMGKGGEKGFANGTIGTKLTLVAAVLYLIVHLLSFGERTPYKTIHLVAGAWFVLTAGSPVALQLCGRNGRP